MNNDPSGQVQPRGQQRVSHHQQPKDSFITFSPFSPTPPSPTSTCGAERSCWRTWGWTLANRQGEGRGRTYSSSGGSRRPLKEEKRKQIKGSWPSPGEGTAGLGVGGPHVALPSLTGSPRSPLLPGAPGLPCRKEGWSQRGRELGTCAVWVLWDVWYPWGKGGCGAMRCEGWWLSMEQWVHRRGYSHSCLQVLGPPSHPSLQGSHGSQEGPGWRAKGRCALARATPRPWVSLLSQLPSSPALTRGPLSPGLPGRPASPCGERGGE